MHTLNRAVRTIAVAFNRMLAVPEVQHTATSWLTTEEERSADAWLIDDVKAGKVGDGELYEAFVEAGVESDEAERLVENYFWHVD